MKKIVLLLILGFSCISCGDDETPIINEPRDCESDAIDIITSQEQAEAIYQFGIDLFQTINSTTDENIVLSPLSIYSALLLVYEGSACETKKQIMRTLQFGVGNQNANTSIDYLNLMKVLEPTSSDTKLSFANALFSDPNRISISENYQRGLEYGYDAEIGQSDFSQETAVDEINKWAEDNTEGKIKQVLEKIDAAEVAFLLNAIYFKGDWLQGFDPDYTTERPFSLRDESTINIPMMLMTSTLKNAINDDMQLVDLPIKGEDYAVSFITTTDISTHIEDYINDENFADNYKELLNTAQSSSIMFSLPKFELKGKQKLKDILIALGMKDAFDEQNADFTRMGTSSGNLFISRVLHDTYIKVDEKGIEGAAVTTVGVGVNSIPPAFTFDRPFIFVLRHIETGVPVFMGKVENPISE